MAHIKKSIIMWTKDNRPILIMLAAQALAFAVLWVYAEWGTEVGTIPIVAFLGGSLTGILAESGTRNLTKGGNAKATFKITLFKTFRDDNGAELVLITVKWITFSIAGIALAKMVASLA